MNLDALRAMLAYWGQMKYGLGDVDCSGVVDAGDLAAFACQYPDPNQKLAHCAISCEAAVWPEIFWQRAPKTYNSPGDDPITYRISDLAKHSWAFWLRNRGDATLSVNKHVNSWCVDDGPLGWMQWNDYYLAAHGGLAPFHRKYYLRELIQNEFRTSAYNLPGLVKIPTMMKDGSRHLRAMLYDPLICYVDRGDINCAQGTQTNMDFDRTRCTNIDAVKYYNWLPKMHSDYYDQPIHEMYPWYLRLYNEAE